MLVTHYITSEPVHSAQINGMASLLSFSLFVTCLCCVSAIPLDQFYRFGEDAGDTMTPKAADGTSPLITLSRAFYFYGKDYFIIVVSAYFYSIKYKHIERPKCLLTSRTNTPCVKSNLCNILYSNHY